MATKIYGKYDLNKAVGLAVLAIALQIGSAGSATQINSCTTISSPGEYILAQNIINSTAGTCIKITSDNVVFDGRNHTIDGVDTFTSAVPSYGIYVNNPAETLINVTVKNLKVTDWDSGILYEGAAGGVITGNLAYSNNIGVYLLSSGNITLANNTANSNIIGVSLYSSSYNTLAGNTGNLNDKNGFFITTSGYNTLADSIADSNCRNGIYLESSGENTLINNKADSNKENGIQLDSSVKNTLSNNTANSNLYGIILGDSHNNVITNNNALYNSYGGIYLGASGDNTLINNTESSNGSEIGRPSNYDGLSNACSDNIYPSGKNIPAERIQITINGSRIESLFDSKIRKVPNPQYISTEDYSKTLTDEELLRMAFNDAQIKQLLEHISKNYSVPLERLSILKANMFSYRYFGQKATKNTDSFVERSFWAVEIKDEKSKIIYELYVRDGTIMNNEQSQELSEYFKKYGKMEWDLYNALSNMKGEDKINIIVWPVIVYPPGFNPDDYVPETTIEYFIQTKGPYDFVILEPLVYSADLPEDIIRELGQRRDIENITTVRKIGNNTRIIVRIKPTIVDKEIESLERFILNRTKGITFMKPVFFANGLTKDTVLELNNRTDVGNLAMQHTFHESAKEENEALEENILRNVSNTTGPEVSGFEMLFGILLVLAVWKKLKK
ncbi:MAG: hypothetical protein FIB07_16230 [Candidatus Methanoperedens sp.]|nr:hypothetical protein [Candidatus Methanoperedens sp.]